MVCDWQENLPGDEMPPRWMWPYDTELEIWFDEVEERRKDQRGGSEDSVPMMKNELARNK